MSIQELLLSFPVNHLSVLFGAKPNFLNSCMGLNTRGNATQHVKELSEPLRCVSATVTGRVGTAHLLCSVNSSSTHPSYLCELPHKALGGSWVKKKKKKMWLTVSLVGVGCHDDCTSAREYSHTHTHTHTYREYADIWWIWDESVTRWGSNLWVLWFPKKLLKIYFVICY